MRRTASSKIPRVSVVMAARNVAAYVEAAIESLQGQTFADFELLVVDDGSTDDTAARVDAMSRSDARIRRLTGPGRGPAAARNLALTQAKGVWIAVVDGDDLLEPGRLAAMVAEGEASQADLVADNLVAFYDDGRSEHVWLEGEAWGGTRDISLDDYLEAPGSAVRQNPLGYLKPLFRRLALLDGKLAYDEALFIGEDYDLVARCLAAGARFRFVPSAGYRYRRHAASISHRILPAQLQSMADGLERLRSVLPEAYRPRLDARLANVRQDLRFASQVEAIKRGHLNAFVAALWVPHSRRRLLKAAAEGLRRRLA